MKHGNQEIKTKDKYSTNYPSNLHFAYEVSKSKLRTKPQWGAQEGEMYSVLLFLDLLAYVFLSHCVGWNQLWSLQLLLSLHGPLLLYPCVPHSKLLLCELISEMLKKFFPVACVTINKLGFWCFVKSMNEGETYIILIFFKLCCL